MYDFFATSPKGLELLLVDELKALGAVDAREKLAGVAFKGDLAVAYRACLWSRLANRILLKLALVPAATPEQLYQGVQTIAWQQHFSVEQTFAIHFASSQSEISHTLFGAQKVKDAIVDQFRAKCGERPNVAKDQPDVQIYVYLYRDQATIGIDLSGESLHKRQYRLETGAAPLKENLAAAILLRAGWPQLMAFGALFDPMCGSGTLLIEAALMAADQAPGLHRDYFGFLGWKRHDAVLWESLQQEAHTRAETGLKKMPPIIGYDQNPEAIRIAFANIERAGMRGKIHVEKQSLEDFAAGKYQHGLVVTNPPYGERLGEIEALKPLYTLLGDRLKHTFTGWQAAVFSANPELCKVMGLRAKKQYALFNGALACKLFLFAVTPEYFVDRSPQAENTRRIKAAQRAVPDALSLPGVAMFVNRLRKNMKHKLRQKLSDDDRIRVYDADLPEYAFAIDQTVDAVYVAEYEAPKNVDAAKVLARRQAVLAVLPTVMAVEPGQIYFTVLAND